MDFFFANPGWLWALPLALAPVLFHLRARSRERVVDFPGAFFLHDPLKPMAERKRRLEDLFLLALRCLMLALLFGVLANPQHRSGAALDESSGSELVELALDDSPGVALRKAPNEKPIPGHAPEWLAQELSELERLLPPGPRRRLGLETATGRNLAPGNTGPLVKKFTELPAAAARSGDRAGLLTRALSVCRDALEDRRIVVLYTDGGAAEDEGTEHALQQRWDAALEGFEDPKTAPVLVLYQNTAKPARQWSVEIPGVVTPGPAPDPTYTRPPLAGQPFALKVRVHCFAGAGRRVLRIESSALKDQSVPALLNTPARLFEQSVELDEGGEKTFDVPALQAEPGAIWFRARLDEPDELPFDDEAELVAPVRPAGAVVLWDTRRVSDAAPRAGVDTTLAALKLALDPLAGTPQSRVKLSVEPRSAGVPNFPPGACVVALHGPGGPSLTQEQAERLRGRVQDGLTLVWIPDFAVRPEDWPAPGLGRALASDPLLPLALQQAEHRVGETEAPWKLAFSSRAHAVLAPFAEGRNGNLGQLALRARLLLGQAALEGAEPVQVLARFDDGWPALALQRCGDGQVLQWAFGIEASGGVAESAAFPILLAEVLEWAAGGRLPESASARTLPGGLSVLPLPPGAKPRSGVLDGPWDFAKFETETRRAGSWTLVVPPRAESVALPDLDQAGLYRFRIGTETRWLRRPFPEADTTLEPWPEELETRLTRAAKDSGGGVAHTPQELAKLLSNLRPGRSLNPWLWVLFALAMLVELGVLVYRGGAG